MVGTIQTMPMDREWLQSVIGIPSVSVEDLRPGQIPGT